MRHDRILFIAAALLAGWATGDVATGEGTAGTVGIGFIQPAPGAIADVYGGAAAFQAGIETRVRRALVALEVGFHRSEATLDAPFFVDAPEGTLTAAPIDAAARLPLGGDALWSPYIGAGFELLWLRESFRYELAGESWESQTDGGFHPGGLFIVGVDRNRFPRIRLEGSYSYVPVHRMRSALGSTYEEQDASHANAGGYGIRVGWRLP